MLEQVDLSKIISKEDYKQIVPALELRLGELQREVRESGIPVMLVFEGWDAAGKGTVMNRLLLTFDPRGYVVHSIFAPNEDERLRPFLWRFWGRIASKGKIAVFNKSWYRRVLIERVDKLVKKREWQQAYDDITSFERQLSDDGVIIIKFFLHISQKEQKKRFEKLDQSPATSWKVTKDDWKHLKQYDRYLEAIEDMLTRTDTDFAPWTIVEAHDARFVTVKVFTTVVQRLQQRIEQIKQDRAQAVRRKEETVPPPTPSDPQQAAAALAHNTLSSSVLDKVDVSVTLAKAEYEPLLEDCQKRLFEIEHEIYARRIPVVIVYQGWDAAGKGGNIRRLVQALDPRGYDVIPIAAPNDIEKAHHYLWRFWVKFPKAGHIAIFDRSWYGRVLDERVEGFCTEEEWRRAYREINEMEAHIVNFGAVIVKFWLHIDPEEQLRRFRDREQTPGKEWKITAEDWRNRAKWDQYKAAVDEMLFRTSTAYAPWTIVEANAKYYARIKALQTVIAAVEARLKA